MGAFDSGNYVADSLARAVKFLIVDLTVSGDFLAYRDPRNVK